MYLDKKKEISDKSKRYYAKNKEHIKSKAKLFYANNTEKCKVTQKKWNSNNKDKINANTSNRQKLDVNFKLASNLRKRLGCALKSNDKVGSFVRDLGCSIDQLKIHLESLFQPGMTWDNYGLGRGKWQIDHIRALCLFDLQNRSDFVIAAHYTNLQPLWHEQHAIKTTSDILIKGYLSCP